MGFQYFLQSTTLPDWFPLSNLQVGQQKVLSLLNMKKDSRGNAIWDDASRPYLDSYLLTSNITKLIPMEPRSRYRVCVVGGGIAGLSCCLELFRICERERIDVEVVLVEGRSRIGGRLWTDHDTFKTADSNAKFAVDLGASWIHGIDLNPLAALAVEAGADFVTASEDVKIFLSGMNEIDPKKDVNAGKIFDELLDLAANDCWSTEERVPASQAQGDQAAVRWYASFLNDRKSCAAKLLSTRPPPHRMSSDVSVDAAVGETIVKHKRSDFAFLSEEERNMLIWNTKNVEYALGADIKDLSMKFWDIDERHAFEGDHVLIRQGYSIVIDHIHSMLKKRGDRFTTLLNFPVEKLEYSRKTSTQPHINTHPRNRKFVDLSDTCCVSSQDSNQSILCDFVVSAVPLGVLKASVSDSNDSKIEFCPPLPFIKVDAINAVGFGIVNKVFIQFPFPFWTRDDILGPDQTQFGNASGINQHLYMFLDIGRTLTSTETGAPAILMTLISGTEAVACEEMSQGEVVKQVMDTLRTLFSKIDVPDPVAYKVTRWGSDRFARGSYTFLAPGSTDEDFETLQSPVNGSGDSILLELSSFETMRLFFAGEHATSLFPSVAHGAMRTFVFASLYLICLRDCK
jgi:monoamine oxidase